MNEWVKDKSVGESWQVPLMEFITDSELEEIEKKIEEILKNTEVCGNCGKDLCECINSIIK